jgi:two-component system chemotaxis sensor kinase CheA
MPAVRAYQVLQAVAAVARVQQTIPGREQLERGEAGERLELRVAGADAQRVRAAVASVAEVATVEVVSATPADAPTASPSAAVQQTVRIDVSVLDRLMNLVGELVIDRTRLARLTVLLSQSGEEGRRELSEIASHLGRVTGDLQNEVMRARLLPVETLFRKFPRLVRDAARQTGKQVEFVMEGQDTELDRSVLEQIGDPLMHILRNAVDHGIEPPERRVGAGKPESGLIRLAACHRDNHVVITVEDDGAGMDAEALRAAAVAKGIISEESAGRMGEEEALQLIFAPGLTTRQEVTALSGRGVGMDVVKRNIEQLSGSVSVATLSGRGSCITIRLPLTLAIVRALLVRIRETALALPLASIVEVARPEAGQLATVRSREVVRIRGRVLPLLRGTRILNQPDDGEPSGGRPLVHLQAGDQHVGLLVDQLLGEQEVVIKGLDRMTGSSPGFTGAAVLANGEVALVVDPVSLLKAVAEVA